MLNLRKLLILGLFAVPAVQAMQQAYFADQKDTIITVETLGYGSFSVEQEVLKCSETLKHQIEDVPAEVIPLANISKEEFEKFLIYLRLVHRIRTKQATLDQPEQHLVKEKDEILYSICRVANYLDVPEILNAATSAIADRLKTKEKIDELLKKGSFNLKLSHDVLKIIAQKMITSEIKKYWTEPIIFKEIIGESYFKDPKPRSIGFNYDGSQIAVGFDDGSIQIWDSMTKKYLATLPSDTQNISGFVYNSVGSQITSDFWDSNGKISRFWWDAIFPDDGYNYKSYSSDKAKKVDFFRHKLWLYNTVTNKFLHPIELPDSTGQGEIIYAKFSPDGNQLLVMQLCRRVSLLYIGNSEEIQPYLEKNLLPEQAALLICLHKIGKDNFTITHQNIDVINAILSRMPGTLQKRIISECKTYNFSSFVSDISTAAVSSTIESAKKLLSYLNFKKSE